MGWGDGVCEGASLDALFSTAKRLPPLTAEDCFFIPSEKVWVPSQKLKQARKEMSKKQQSEVRAVRLVVQRAPTAQSRCRCCGGVIEKGALRVGYPTADPRGAYGLLTCWLHATPSCGQEMLNMLLPSELHPTELYHLRQLLEQQVQELHGEQQPERDEEEQRQQTKLEKQQQDQQEGNSGGHKKEGEEPQDGQQQEGKAGRRRVKKETGSTACSETMKTSCTGLSEEKQRPTGGGDPGDGEEGGDSSTVTSEGGSPCSSKGFDSTAAPTPTAAATAAAAATGAAATAAATATSVRLARAKLEGLEGEEQATEVAMSDAKTPVERRQRTPTEQGGTALPPSSLRESSSDVEAKKENAGALSVAAGGAAVGRPADSEASSVSTGAASAEGDKNNKKEGDDEEDKPEYPSKMHAVLGEALQLELLCYALHPLTSAEEMRMRVLLSEAAFWAADEKQASAFKKEQQQQHRAGSGAEEGLGGGVGAATAAGEGGGDVNAMVKALVQRKIEGRISSPPDLLLPLLPFQEEGVWWMCRQEKSEVRGGILADEMGMGKTIQVIALLLTNPLPKLPRGLLRSAASGCDAAVASSLPRLGQTLIVTPLASLLQWKGELERFVRPGRLSVLVYHGAFRSSLLRGDQALEKYDVILTTYQTVEQDFRRETNKHKRLCKYCGRLFLPEKLAVHQRYFCGPEAQRTAKQRLTARKQGTQRAMETLHITARQSTAATATQTQQQQQGKRQIGGRRAAAPAAASKDERGSRTGGENGEEERAAAGAAREEEPEQGGEGKKRKGQQPKRRRKEGGKGEETSDQDGRSRELSSAQPSSSGSSPSSFSASAPAPFVPTPSNVLRELMQQANRDFRDCGVSWACARPLRFMRRRLPPTNSSASFSAHSSSSSSSSSRSRTTALSDAAVTEELTENEAEKKHVGEVTSLTVGGSNSSNSSSSSGRKQAGVAGTGKKGGKTHKGTRKRKKEEESDDGGVSESVEEDALMSEAADACCHMGFNRGEALLAAVAAGGCIEEAVRLLTESREDFFAQYKADTVGAGKTAVDGKGTRGRGRGGRKQATGRAAGGDAAGEFYVIDTEESEEDAEEATAGTAKERKKPANERGKETGKERIFRNQADGRGKNEKEEDIEERMSEETDVRMGSQSEEEEQEEEERRRRALALRREINMSKSDIAKQKVAVLQVLLRRCGLPTSGSKQQLITRLSRQLFPSAEGGTATDEEEEVRSSCSSSHVRALSVNSSSAQLSRRTSKSRSSQDPEVESQEGAEEREAGTERGNGFQRSGRSSGRGTARCSSSRTGVANEEDMGDIGPRRVKEEDEGNDEEEEEEGENSSEVMKERRRSGRLSELRERFAAAAANPSRLTQKQWQQGLGEQHTDGVAERRGRGGEGGEREEKDVEADAVDMARAGGSKEKYSKHKEQTNESAGKKVGKKKKSGKKKSSACSNSAADNSSSRYSAAPGMQKDGIRVSPRLVELQQQQQQQQRQTANSASGVDGGYEAASASSSSSCRVTKVKPSKKKKIEGKEEEKEEGHVDNRQAAAKKKKPGSSTAQPAHGKAAARRRGQPQRQRSSSSGRRDRRERNEEESNSLSSSPSSSEESAYSAGASSEEEWTGSSEGDSSDSTSLYTSSDVDEASTDSEAEEETEGRAEEEEGAADSGRRWRDASGGADAVARPRQEQPRRGAAAIAAEENGRNEEEEQEEWERLGNPVEEEEEEDVAVLGMLMKKSVLHSIVWQRLVLDEAHRIKSRSSSTAQAIIALRTGRLVCSMDTRGYPARNSNSSRDASNKSSNSSSRDTSSRSGDASGEGSSSRSSSGLTSSKISGEEGRGGSGWTRGGSSSGEDVKDGSREGTTTSRSSKEKEEKGEKGKGDRNGNSRYAGADDRSSSSSSSGSKERPSGDQQALSSSISSAVKTERTEEDGEGGKEEQGQKMRKIRSSSQNEENLGIHGREKREVQVASTGPPTTGGDGEGVATAEETTAVTYELKVGGGRWCLTGTPLQNRVGELFSLIKFLRVYPYAYYFCKKNGCRCRSLHFRFIEGRECVKCGHSRMSHFSLFNQKVINPIKRCGFRNEGIVALNNLKRDVLDVVLLRRTKAERAADVKLPPLVVRIRRDALSPEERDFYESLFKQTAIQFDAYVEAGTVLHNFAHIFDLLSRLRQAVDHPYLLVHGSLMPLDGVSLLPTASRNVSALGICALCQDDVEHAEHLVEAACGHAFHRACLADYVASAPVDGGGRTAAAEGKAAAGEGREAGEGGARTGAAASGECGKPLEVLGCPACYAPLTVDLTTLQHQQGEEAFALATEARAGGGGRGGKRVAGAARGNQQEHQQEEGEGAEGEEEKRKKHGNSSCSGDGKGKRGRGRAVGEEEDENEEEELEEVLQEEERFQQGEDSEEAAAAAQPQQQQQLRGVAGIEHWLQQVHGSKNKVRGIMGKIKASEFRSSTKIEALFQELQEAEKEDPTVKSLVFSQFCSMIDLIEWRLKKGGIRCAKFVGSMSVVSRSSVLYAFNNDPSLKVLLLSLKAGGEGLNLQAASRIFLMDPWWNPAAEMQAIQRAHRIGQRHQRVIATRFIAEKTIEERILQLQEKKRLVFDGTVGSSQEAMAKLTQEDLRFLFQN